MHVPAIFLRARMVTGGATATLPSCGAGLANRFDPYPMRFGKKKNHGLERSVRPRPAGLERGEEGGVHAPGL